MSERLMKNRVVHSILLGLLSVCSSLALAQEQTVRQAIDSNLGDHKKYDSVISALQKSVKNHDAAAVAALVEYPIDITIDGRKRTFKTAKEFIASYDRIMTPKVTAAIVDQKYGDLFVNWQGVSFDDGQVWINGICKDTACKNFDVKVSRSRGDERCRRLLLEQDEMT